MKSLSEWIRYHGGYATRCFCIRAGRPLPAPCGVQVQTINTCNGHCVMCPYSGSALQGKQHVMSEDLYLRLLEQLRENRLLLWFSPMFQNEPLLDESLATRLRQARDILPAHVNLLLVSNGSLLTQDRANELIASGMDRIDISIDAFTEATYRKVRPGLEFNMVVQNTERLLAMKSRCEVRVRFLRQQANASEEQDFVRYWRSRGARVMALPCHNRRASVDDLAVHRDRKPSPVLRLKRWARHLVPACLYPFAHLYVLSDGRVLPCCNEWTATHIMGNLETQSLKEIWHGAPLKDCRGYLSSWRYQDSELCRQCTVVTRHGAWS